MRNRVRRVLEGVGLNFFKDIENIGNNLYIVFLFLIFYNQMIVLLEFVKIGVNYYDVQDRGG